MVVRWSEKLEDRFSAAFAIPGFYSPESDCFDFDIILRDPAFCRLAVELLSREVNVWAAKERVDYIAFLEKRANTTGALTLAGALTIHTGIPHLVVRLRKDIPHERIKFSQAAGEYPLKDAKVVLLTDYATTGTKLQPAVKAVTSLGGKVIGIVVLVWDEERFNKNGEMSEVGITEEMISLVFTKSKAKQIAVKSKKVIDAILAKD